MTAWKRRLLRLGLSLFVLGAPLIYAFFLEPNWLEVSQHRIEAPVTRPLRIAVLGDLHTPNLGYLERSVLAAIAEEKPDLIVFPGDLMHATRGPAPVQAFIRALPAPPSGIWVVPGNWERWLTGADTPQPFTLPQGRWLVNSSSVARDDVWITGLDDPLGGTPNVKRSLLGVPDTGLRLALVHSPTGADLIAGKVDLVIAGHTHGGQVRVPFYGPLLLPPESGDYDVGWYERGTTRVFVTRGLGMSVLPVRFGCRPELAIIDVVPPQ